MQIDWNQTIAGIPLPQIRDMLRHVGQYSFNAENLAQRMRSGRNDYPSKAERAAQDRKGFKILQVLAASGLIEKSRYFDGYVLNDNGLALAAATMLPRMTRKAADKAVDKLVDKIEEINANPVYMHDVTEVCLFGSYIEDTEDLGDIDVGYTLSGRWIPGPEGDFESRKKAFREEFPPPRSFDNYRFWAETLTRRHLRVNRRINLTPMRDVKEMGCPYLLIYPKKELIKAKPDWKDERESVRIVEDDGRALRNLNTCSDHK